MSSYRINRSNGLSKSSSQPNYLIPYELNDYNKVYLPLIKINQQAEILSNKIDKTNRIKDEILASKYKLYNNRGINNNYNYYRNKFKDSWDNFYKRKEREKRRKKIYKIIKDEEPYYISSEEENDDEIFRKGMLNKIEDKIKLKQYLPAKRDLAKLMFRVNDNINERIDKNSYLLSKNIIELENGYGELKDMIQNKINKLERKQEEDFYDLRLYFKRRAQREKDKFDNNKLILENGNDVYQVNNNIEDNYNYKANMKDNIEKLQTYEITKRIQNIPNLFDNAIKNIERIRMQRKKEKNDFLLHISNQINDYNENIYEDIDDDLIGERQKYNNYNDYAYNLDNYNDSFMGYEDTFLTGSSQNYYINKYSKPRTDYKRNSKKDMLSMSKSNVLSLKKNLKPLSYQSQKKNKMNLNDNDDSLTASDLKEIYKQKIKKKNTLEKKRNEINSNKEISIKENKTINKSKESKEKKETNKKEDSDDDVVVVESDDDKTKSQKKETKNEEKEKSEENNNKEKEKEKKEEVNENIEKKEENKTIEKKEDNNSEEEKEEVNENIEKKEENKTIEKKEDNNNEEEKEENEKSEEEGDKESNNNDEDNEENEDEN